MPNFQIPTKVHMGDDSLDVLDEFAGAKVLVVTDGFLATTDHFKEIVARLDDVKVFDKVEPNPTVDLVAQGVAEYLQFGPEIVLAYGGGSAIDTAKAVHLITGEDGRGAPGGIVVIPTTSGSGSEVTSYAVITDEANETKIPLLSEKMYARIAILDPEAVRSCPSKTTADSGMDVLTHATEAYVSTDANDFTDALAEKAVSLVFENLHECFVDGNDMDARKHMHSASSLAASSFENAGLGITHSLAHALGGHFHVAHGRLNAILLPHVIEYNSQDPQAMSRYARLGRMVSPDSNGPSAVRMFIQHIRRMNEKLQIPDSLHLAGVDSDECRKKLDEMTASAMVDRCTQTNPVKPTEEDLRQIILRAL